MRLKQCIFAFVAMLLCAFSANAQGGSVAKIGDTEYTTFADAMAAANATTGDVTIEVYDKVTLNTAFSGSYSSINFVGKDTDAEIYLDVQGYITATGKKVSFTDLTLSKSAGGYMTNAGFMNVAFGIYDVVEVAYTNCVFANGAYASSGNVTFDNCTFYRSHEKYGLWAYGNVDVAVEGCTFADYRGIKMYAEGAAKTVDLTVKNTDFSAVTDKPAIVLTYGESVVLEGNTYSSTGTFELDLDGAPNGTAVTSDVAPTCKNDNGTCGVLVDGKIYTTVAQAVDVATEGSNVTLLYSTTETAEFAEGVNLTLANGVTADDVTVATSGVAKVGDTTYATLEEAFKAATEGCTIDILADVTVDYYWDCRNTGSKFFVPVTINGNDHTLKFTNVVYDGGNHFAAFRFEADATVNNLTVDMTEAQSGFNGRFRAISSKANLTVNGCTFIGNGSANNTRAIIFGEGAGSNAANLAISIANSNFEGWRRGISDNENGQDVKSVTVTGNTLKDAAVYVSANETVTFTGNTVEGAYVNINSYTTGNTLDVTATGNTLEANTGDACNSIQAGGTVDAQGEFVVPAKGSNSFAYTKEENGYVRVWGEGGGNAKESYELKLYSGETLIATTKLNNVGNVINGDVYVTWNFYYPESTDEYWTTTWEAGHPNSAAQPTEVELYIDGTLVATTAAKMSGADDVAPVVWRNLGGVAIANLLGEGTAENPYLIETLKDLKFFRDDVNTYTQDGSNQYKGKYVKLTADIDLAGENWEPIGKNSNGDHQNFLGTFYGEKADGTKPTISNLYINADGDHLGFFARVGSYAEGLTPTVKNIKFNNVDVSSNTTNSHSGSYVAGVIANAGGNSVVSGIEVTGDVYVVGYGYIGGIVGHGYPDIDNCHVAAKDGSYIHSHYWCVGGIIGYAGEGGTPITNSSVSGVDIWSAYGAAAAIAGLLNDGNKLENVSASNVDITSNSDYCMGYIAGNGNASTMTGISIENVTATAKGNPITPTDAIAKVNDAVYFSLSAALNAAQAGETVTLIADVNENVTVAGNVTIDGAGKKYTGTMTGNAGLTVTVQNVNFVNGGFVKNASGNTGIYTFKDCTFDGAGTYAYPLSFKGANTINVENCTVKDYANSFLYVRSSTANVNVKDVTVENCPSYAVYFSSGVTTATFENLTVKKSNKGFIINNTATRAFTIKNCTMEDVNTAINYSKGTSDITCTALGVNDFGEAALSDYVIIKGATVDGTNYYGSVQGMVEKAVTGQTVKLLSDIAMTEADCVAGADRKVLVDVAGKDITLDMNGKKISVVHEDAFTNDYIVAVVRVADGAGLTVTGEGTIDVKTLELNPDIAYMFWKRGTTGHLTIKNGTYKMNDSADSMVYTNGNEIVTIEGGTWELAAYGTRGNREPWIFNVQGAGDNHVIVTGGTFNADINRQFWSNEVLVPETHYTVANADSTAFTVKEGAKAYVNEGMLTGPYFVRKNIGYPTFVDAVAGVDKNETITLLEGVTLEAVVTTETDSITIDLNEKTVTGADGAVVFDIKADATIKNGTILGNKGGTSSGLIDIYANLAMDGVTLETSKINALRFKAGDCTATLDNCNITGAFKGYGGSVWAINSGTYKAASTSINDQLNGTAQISGGTFHYEITDEECAPGYSVVNNGDGTYTVKYAPVCFVDTNNNGTLDEGETVYGSLATVFNTIKEGDVYIVLTSNTAIAEQVDTDVDAKYYLNTNVAEGVTVDFAFADDWNFVQKMYVGEDVTLNAPNLLAWTDLEVHGTINTDYLYIQGGDVLVAEGAVVNATTGDATVQVKNGAKLTVNGELNTSILNVWVGDAKLVVDGVNAKVNASWVDIWDGTPVVDVENGATLAVENIKASRGGSIEVADATLAATGTIELGHNRESTGTLTETGESTITGNIKLTVEGSTVKSDGGLTNVTTDLEGYGVVYENGEYKVVALPVIAKIGDVEYYSLQEALDAAAAGTGNVTVEILADVNLTDIDWNPVTVSGPGYPLVTVEGGNHIITGLNDMLFHSTWAGGSGLIIKDLTIENSTIVNDKDDAATTVGVGAFIGYPQASATITLENCHLKNSSVEGGHWTGGLIGMAGGYNGNDGPVFMNLTIKGCSVTGSTITGKGSVGGVIGHGSCAAWTNVVIEETTVEGNTITSTGSSNVKAGAIMGTIGAAGQPTTANGETRTGGASVSATVAGNTVTSNGTEITTIYGRQGTPTGQLYVAGGSYDNYPIEENVAYAAPIEGYEIVQNTDGTYGIQEIPAYVAKIGEQGYATLAEAVAAVEDGGTITMIANETFTENNRYNNGGWWDGLGYSGDKSFTIDLNNFTISQDGALNDYLMWFKNDGAKDNTITLKNGTLDAGTTAYCALATASSNAKKITVNLENISLINNNSNGSTVKVRGGAVLNVKDGTVITGKDSYLGVECSAATVNIYDGAEIYMNGTSSYNGCLAGAGGNGTINVYGGYGKGAKGGFIAMTSGGTINIEGGEWIANTDGSIGNNSNVYVLTAQSNINEQGFVGPAIINVTGGTFRGGMDAWVLNNHKDEKAELNISGGNFNADPVAFVADGYAALPDLNGNYVVGVKPTATVHNLGMTTVAAGDYSIWNGSFDQNTEDDGDMPLSFVMQFLADQDAEDMDESPYADWYGDFVITFTGIENGEFTADGCYLAGHYGSFGWVKVPVDGMTIEEGARYPVMLGVGMGQKYDYICSSVEDFKCALYLTPEILEANPNIQVKLELAVVDNSNGPDDAASALVNNDKVYSVTEYTYDAEDFVVDPNYIAELVIDDAKGENYTNDTEKTVGTLTYKRTLAEGAWNPLYLPFEIELTDELLANYDFADYNQMISHDTNGDRVPDSFEMELFIYTGGTLEANYPYFVRPKNEEACSMNLVLTDATLYPANENSLVTSSVKNTFKLSGTYKAMDAAALAGKYAISIDGDWSYTSALKPYRLYLTITDNNGAVVTSVASKSIRIVVRGEDGYTGVEGVENENGEDMIFDLQGRRVLEPEKGGLYIKNGKKIIF